MRFTKFVFVVLALACLAGVAGAWPRAAAAALSSTPDEDVWVTDGDVKAIAVAGDGTTYIGGGFTFVGPRTGSGVALNPTSGERDTTFPLVDNGEVLAVAADGAGGYYIGGTFTMVGGLTRSRIAHILADGTVAPSFSPSVSGDSGYVSVSTLAVAGGVVYAGGSFTTIGGQDRNCIAALDATSGNATAWNPNLNAGGTIQALAVSGSTVYAGGSFETIGGQSRNNIAALDATSGNATAWNPLVYGAVNALAVSGSTVYIGGSFDEVGEYVRNKIAALDATSGVATAWDPNPSYQGYAGYAEVNALAVSGSTVYAGGMFTTIGGQDRHNLAALDATSGNATPWTANTGAIVQAVAVSGSTVFAGGWFWNDAGANPGYFAALDATSGNERAWNPKANGTVSALAVSGSTVYVGGSFSSLGEQTARVGIAALDANGNVTSWDPNASSDYANVNALPGYASVNALAVSGGLVYAGGYFTTIGGQTRSGIAALDATSGNATAWNPNASGDYASVNALAVSGGLVYAGGSFTTIGGQDRNCIAALDATSGNATAWNPNASGDYAGVNALAVSGGLVYAGGSFTTIGGQDRNYVAALDATSGNATAWNPNASYSNPADPFTTCSVNALAVSGGVVYAGGSFTTIGGQSRNNISALDASSGSATAWNPNASGDYAGVNALAVSGGLVYGGGYFTTIGGQDRNCVAALDATSGNATAWNPNPNDGVSALAVSGATVYVGGDFTTIGGQSRSYLARFSSVPSTAPTLTGFTPASGLTGTAVTLTGTNLTGATSVTFNGTAASFTVVSATQITATVPAGATSGKIAVTTAGGTATSAGDFTVATPAPAMTSVTPASGPVGTSVTLSGTNLAGATAVTFNATAASFTVNSSTQITATVPAGATTGKISVTTPGGTATSAADFTVTTPAVTPTLTLKLVGLKSGSIKLGKSLTAKGVVTPTSLAGSKVTLTAQLKKGTKWVKAKTAAATISPTGTYSWKYKPAKKGAYRLQCSIAKTATSTAAETAWRSFKVK